MTKTAKKFLEDLKQKIKQDYFISEENIIIKEPFIIEININNPHGKPYGFQMSISESGILNQDEAREKFFKYFHKCFVNLSHNIYNDYQKEILSKEEARFILGDKLFREFKQLDDKNNKSSIKYKDK